MKEDGKDEWAKQIEANLKLIRDGVLQAMCLAWMPLARAQACLCPICGPKPKVLVFDGTQKMGFDEHGMTNP